jgi:uncharacterized protein (DUF488 family)
MAIYTSAFWSPKAIRYFKEGSAVAVGICLYPPKTTEEKYGYSLLDNIRSLAPDRTTFKIDDKEDFRKPFRHSLHRRQNHIWKRLEDVVDRAEGRDIILMCFDKVGDGPDEWCHREFVAEWLVEHGIDCEEL